MYRRNCLLQGFGGEGKYETYKKFKDAKLAGIIRPVSARMNPKIMKKASKQGQKASRPSTTIKKKRVNSNSISMGPAHHIAVFINKVPKR